MTKLLRGALARVLTCVICLACALPALAVPHIKNVKLAVTNPSDQDLAAAAVTVRVADLKKIAPDLVPTAVIVTATDAATVDEDAGVLQTQNVSSHLGKNDPELTFLLALKPPQTRIV